MAAKYDIQRVLHEADKFLAATESIMVAQQDSPNSIWKFLRLADAAGLVQCIPILTDQAVRVDFAGCASAEHQQQLSRSTLQHLITSLVQGKRPGPSPKAVRRYN